MRDKFIALQERLSSSLIERGEATRGLVLALLAGEHALLVGPPGVAKSMLVRKFVSCFEGATLFERLLTRFSVPEELFGPLSLPELEAGRYTRVSSGSLTEAHMAFLDECFKANSSILNTLLGVMNERVYHEHGGARKVPLVTLIGASNEIPDGSSEDGEALCALYDRFLVRVRVLPVQSQNAFIQVINSPANGQPSAPLLTLDEVKTAQQEARKIPLGARAQTALLTIRTSLMKKGVLSSDRRWKQSVGLMRAAAWLDGSDTILGRHAAALAYTLWHQTKDIQLVTEAIADGSAFLVTTTHRVAEEAKELIASVQIKMESVRSGQEMFELMKGLVPQLKDMEDGLSNTVKQATDGIRPEDMDPETKGEVDYVNGVINWIRERRETIGKHLVEKALITT